MKGWFYEVKWRQDIMYDLKKMRSDLKYIIKKLDYNESDIFSTDKYIEVLLGKTKVKDAIFFLIIDILNNNPEDFDDMSIGAYGTVYGHKNNLKIAKGIAETDKHMAQILDDYLV